MSGRLSIDVTTETPQWRDQLPNAEDLAQTAASSAWDRAGGAHGDAELSIVLGDDAMLQSLNRQFRNKDRPTNVLSFPADDLPADGAPRLLGDVVLALETIHREAADQGKSLADHFQHLCVHGMLHLLGHDHEADNEAKAMESLEIEILSGLGIADPYAIPEMQAAP